MTSLIVLLSIVCVSLAGASIPQYDLLSLFPESTSLASLRRMTRNADGHPNITCCGSDIPTIPEKEKGYMDECRKQYGLDKPPAGGPKSGPPSKDGKDEMKKKMACAGQCLAQKEELLDSSNMIDADKLSASVGSIFSDAEVKTFAQETAKKCAQDANEKAKAMGDIDYNGTKCNPAFARAMMCLHIEMELYCPDDKKVQSPDCDTKRDRLTKMKKHVES